MSSEVIVAEEAKLDWKSLPRPVQKGVEEVLSDLAGSPDEIDRVSFELEPEDLVLKSIPEFVRRDQGVRLMEIGFSGGKLPELRNSVRIFFKSVGGRINVLHTVMRSRPRTDAAIKL